MQHETVPTQFEMGPLTYSEAVELYVLLWQQVSTYLTEEVVQVSDITVNPAYLRIFTELTTYLRNQLPPDDAEQLSTEIVEIDTASLEANQLVWKFLIKRYSWSR